MTIGQALGQTPQDARKAAQQFAGLVAIGRDPGAERKAARQTSKIAMAPVRDTIEKVAAAYLRHAEARTRESTFRETKRVYAVEILPAWRGRRLSEITKAVFLFKSQPGRFWTSDGCGPWPKTAGRPRHPRHATPIAGGILLFHALS